LKNLSVENAQAIGAGHVFVLLMRDCFPINVLGRIKDCMEVCSISCATANPVEVILAESQQGRGILGMIDGSRPRGVETPQDASTRIGYKR
jgi:adenosine/AMP kinase